MLVEDVGSRCKKVLLADECYQLPSLTAFTTIYEYNHLFFFVYLFVATLPYLHWTVKSIKSWSLIAWVMLAQRLVV